MASTSQIDELRARIAQIEAGHSLDSSLQESSASDEPVRECFSLDCGSSAAGKIGSGFWDAEDSAFLCDESEEVSPGTNSHEKKGPAAEKKEKPKDAAQAYQRILRIVATREQSSVKVREKLARAEFAPDMIDEAMDRAERVGVVDDARYCDALISSALRGGKGMAGVLREVESLGISPENLDSYQTYLEEGEEGQVRRARLYLEAHPVRSKNKRDGAFRKLVNRGYSVSVASAAARAVYPYRPQS